ncbi:MAG: FAD:protein FMN transferase [Candidatus Marinimicrobia bacterium]|nr:FAD:protein FMN transferase [Candidatus Neomarinimicrobiota bacterium]MBT5538540.1 FAD:protein FMN transferase [Candidatus Neomarinimicrobiota bacterium]MBT6216253.1 FAD:protein FMN transferase [Candidatus Neomarinimicrobiota bacterium]
MFKQKLKVRLIPGFLFLCMIFLSCQANPGVIVISGNTMGTTYMIKINHEHEEILDAVVIKSKIDSILVQFNHVVSTYEPDSEISQFNIRKSTESFLLSETLKIIVQRSLRIYELSNGAFDITIHPMVKLWGFGSDGPKWSPPDDDIIQTLLSKIGSAGLTLDDDRLVKSHPDLEMDLSAVAKGYGVDIITSYLHSLNYQDFMIEVGGEIYCSGDMSGKLWTIGIELPNDGVLPENKFAGIISLENKALATSGNYRNFFIKDNVRYSHTIDPETGYPVTHNISSVSVVADECIYADALATAVMVMGSDKGMKMIESMEGVECLIIEELATGEFQTKPSSGFNRYIRNER